MAAGTPNLLSVVVLGLKLEYVVPLDYVTAIKKYGETIGLPGRELFCLVQYNGYGHEKFKNR